MSTSLSPKTHSTTASEGEINKMALGSNQDGLRRALGEYQRIILCMTKEYEALKEKKGQGMFKFVERPKSPAG